MNVATFYATPCNIRYPYMVYLIT